MDILLSWLSNKCIKSVLDQGAVGSHRISGVQSKLAEKELPQVNRELLTVIFLVTRFKVEIVKKKRLNELKSIYAKKVHSVILSL